MQNRVRSGEKIEQERNGDRPERDYGTSVKSLAQKLQKSKIVVKDVSSGFLHP